MTDMDVGIFLAMEPCNRPAAEDYAEFLDLVQQAEELGYRSVWMATRHFSPAYAADPSPLVLLAAAAARTRRLEFGPSVVTLPLENPLRLAEDFATLDALSNGRARLGLGSGDDPPAFKAMGVDFDERAGTNTKLMPELLDVLSGKDLGGVKLYPTIENPLSKVAMGAQSARGASWAASLRIGLLQGRAEPKSPDPTVSQTRAAEAYRAVFPDGRVVTARNAWIGNPEDPELLEALGRYDAYLQSRGKERLSDPKAAIKKLHIVSHPDPQVLARDIAARVAPINPDELLITVDPGGLEASERSKRVTLMAEGFGLRAG